MNRKQLEKIIDCPTRTFRANGKVYVEIDRNDVRVTPYLRYKYPHVGWGKNIPDAIQHWWQVYRSIETMRSSDN